MYKGSQSILINGTRIKDIKPARAQEEAERSKSAEQTSSTIKQTITMSLICIPRKRHFTKVPNLQGHPDINSLRLDEYIMLAGYKHHKGR